MKNKAVSYEYISFIIDLLAQRVKQDYDYIIGIGRGGLIPATMLAYKLKKKVITFGIATYNETHQSDNYFIYQEPVLQKDLKYLVIDDICDTGNTFEIFEKRYSRKDYNYEFASLFARDSKVDLVDYYGFSVPEGVWLDFEYES